MELIKRNIHMDRIKCNAVTQITLEEDRNVPDQKPDMERILLRKGDIRITEWKIGENRIQVKGQLVYRILYLTEEESVSYIDGEIPFEETIYMDGIQMGDAVEIESHLEDLSIEMINSRKVSIRALLMLRPEVEELYDEEVIVDLYSSEDVEMRKDTLHAVEIALQKKDILRWRDEFEIPQNYPNVFEILWKDIFVEGLGFETQDDKIVVQGDIRTFVLYEGEGEEHPIKFYEKTIPLRETLECQGCKGTMLQNVSAKVSHGEIEVKSDADGEERLISLDVLLDLVLKLYAEEQLDVVTDVYGIKEKLEPVKREGRVNCQLFRTIGKNKVMEQIKLPADAGDWVSMCYCNAEPIIEEKTPVENGIELLGTMTVTALYFSEGDRMELLEEQIPFEYVLELPDESEDCRYDVTVTAEQLSISPLPDNEADVRVILKFELFGFCMQNENLMIDIREEKQDVEMADDLPGIVAYVALDGDDIWELGKRYHVMRSRIREMNHLDSDILKKGQKVLIVR